MNVEKLVKELKSQEKELIIESMKKLIEMITDTPKTQEEIIKFLPGRDIIRLMRNLEDSDANFRKLTAKFFLDLVYGNYIVQQVFCDILGIVPCDGKVCLNRIPDVFKSVSKSLIECLDQLKKVSPEELKEELPFCWYLGIQSVDRSGKKVDFVSKSDVFSDNFELENFVDPLYAMIGFIMRNPRLYERRIAEAQEKSSSTHNTKKSSTITGYTTQANSISARSNRLASSTNSSLDQSINRRLLNETSRSPNSSKLWNNATSPVRGSIGKNGIFSSRYNYKAKQTATGKTSGQANTNTCKTERLALGDFESSRDRRDDLTYKSSERDPNDDYPRSSRAKNFDTKVGDKKSLIRETEGSVDNFDHYKYNGSINESREHNGKVLETSLNSSMNQGMKGIATESRSPNVTQDIKGTLKTKKAKISVNSKENKGNADSSKDQLTLQTQSISKKSSDKSTEYDHRLKKDHERKQLFKAKDQNVQSSSSTPKNNLLTKLLKEKPFVFKDNTYSSKYKSIQDNLKKQNNTGNTTASPVISTTTTPKPRTANQGTAQQKIIEKLEQQYMSKKQAFHSSLMKSLDATSGEKGNLLITTVEEAEESQNDHNLYRDIKTASSNSTRDRTSYLTSFTFKSPITTPRVPNELKSNSFNTAKLLNARKSHDITYLTKHQKKNSNDMFQNHTVTQIVRGSRGNYEIKEPDSKTNRSLSPTPESKTRSANSKFSFQY